MVTVLINGIYTLSLYFNQAIKAQACGFLYACHIKFSFHAHDSFLFSHSDDFFIISRQFCFYLHIYTYTLCPLIASSTTHDSTPQKYSFYTSTSRTGINNIISDLFAISLNAFICYSTILYL